MDINEYIESGVLESYAMGELSDEEMQEVDVIVEKHPDVQQELMNINAAINSYAKSLNKLPSKSILDNVLSEVENEEDSTPIRHIGKSETNTPRSETKKSIPFWAIAASVLFFVSAGLNLYFYSQLEESRGEIEALTLDRTRLADNYNNASQQLDMASQQLDYAQLRIAHFLNEDNIHVRMDGLEISPESYANVFWNKKTNAVFISVDNLPTPPDGHQYQLWAIKSGQAPIDAGIFDHNQLVQELKVIRGDVQAFAVTLEKEGGTPFATVDRTFVKGFLKNS